MARGRGRGRRSRKRSGGRSRKGGRGRGSSKRINWHEIMRKVREGEHLTKREREFLSRALDRRKKAKDER